VGILLLLVLISRRRSFLTTPETQPALNIISAAGKKQNAIDELTKKHIIAVQLLSNPNDITAENAKYAAEIKKIEDEYKKEI
jgi:hypothetical protein